MRVVAGVVSRSLNEADPHVLDGRRPAMARAKRKFVAKKKVQERVEEKMEEKGEKVDLDDMDYTVESDAYPAFLDDNGNLLSGVSLGFKDFTMSQKAGKVAFCDYKIAYYTDRRRTIIQGKSEKEKLQDRIARGRKQLAAMKEKLEAIEAGEEE